MRRLVDLAHTTVFSLAQIEDAVYDYAEILTKVSTVSGMSLKQTEQMFLDLLLEGTYMSDMID